MTVKIEGVLKDIGNNLEFWLGSSYLNLQQSKNILVVSELC